MLGETIADPDGVEEGGSIRGMELLSVTTVRVNSARAAAPENPRAHRSTAAINAAGSRRIRLIRRSSVLSAEMYLTTTIKNKTAA